MYALNVDKMRNQKSHEWRIVLKERQPVRVGRSRNISKPLIEDDKILSDKIVHWDEVCGGEGHTLTRTGKIGGPDGCLLLLEEAKHVFLRHKSVRWQAIIGVKGREDLESNSGDRVIRIVR
jgi:hypothetical protein